MTKSDEQLLMQQLSDPKTQRAAFERLVREYSEPLYWQVRRMVLCHDDADDIMQNVFLKAWSHLKDFNQDSKISTWLYRIAVNESLDFLRRKKSQHVFSVDEPLQSVSQSLVADRYFDGDETAALLQEAIAQLPEVQRMVFNLRYFDEMKYSDISELLHTSEGALKASYHIAVKKISEFFKQHD
ncbi:RNA polymerase sigma-70 factor, ECF subfamily [Prevotellaceae bacterium HUN156]|jgi:RNA polymerase sigma-70 factor (ECF subfamily)|nr:RNA polymerase sigma-70 factor, ECF subfamily [Prevotellaceae bacterium HUN156]